MLIRIGFDLMFDVPAPTVMLLMLRVHPSREASLRAPEHIRINPGVPVQEFTDAFGNRCGRLLAPAGQLRLRNDALVEDSGELDPVALDARQHAVDELPVETLPFLLGSRYCEVDRLTETAWRLFGDTMPGWSRVRAVVDWCHANVEFGYPYARATKTALEVFTERQGVCRDFTHLAVTFCRCLGLPARYVTGYLGDIGIPPLPDPMDFSAWFEVYLDGRWWTFDARHNHPRIGRIVMARGRDAVDVALTTSFGPTTLTRFVVVTDEVREPAVAASHV